MFDSLMLRRLFLRLFRRQPAAWAFVWLVCAALAPTAVRAAADFLDPDVAFRFSASQQPGEIDFRYTVANGYYLYRERFAFSVKSGSASLGAPVFPSGTTHFDPTFGKNVEIYRNEVVIRIPVTQAAGPFDLAATSQGCADQGICYPPMTHVYRVDGAALQRADAAGGADAGRVRPAAARDRLYDPDYAQTVLRQKSLPVVLAIFFGLGVAMSLLPCSLPMLPILSSIIVGQGGPVTRMRGAALSLAYVFGVATVYATAGVAAALAGASLGAWLQNPWVLGAFAMLLVAFALSLFGCYELDLPQAWRDRLDAANRRRTGGRLLPVFAMGALSALVVGACMTAPLFGVLAFIAQTRDVLLGGAALFVLALGLGVPLLCVGVGAGALLPRAGLWMDGIKRGFGMLLLAAAWWIVVPVLPAVATMLTAALWLWVAAAALVGLRGTAVALPLRHLRRGLGAACAVAALSLMAGAAAGSRDLLQPLAIFVPHAVSAAADAAPSAGEHSAAGPVFAPVRSVDELDRAVHAAGRPTMLDFYADWCSSCREMERFTFTDPRVRARLSRFNLLRADVTADSADDRALLRRFSLYGPPGIIFFDAQGNEMPSARVIGEQPAEVFLRSLDRVPNS